VSMTVVSRAGAVARWAAAASSVALTEGLAGAGGGACWRCGGRVLAGTPHAGWSGNRLPGTAGAGGGLPCG
jgi:hypothetical protein